MGQEALCSAVNCGGTEPVAAVVALFLTGVAAFLALSALVHIRDGKAVVADERSRTRSERRAFEAFASRVEGIDLSPGGGTNVRDGHATVVRTRAGDGRLREVQDAYRETVMSVSHYDDEYDESLAANMAAELGEEVATAVHTGSGLSPGLKEALVERSQQTARDRATLGRALAREEAALEDAHATLTGLDEDLEALVDPPAGDRSFEDLVCAWHRLDDLQGRLRALLDDRQAALRERAPASPGRVEGSALSFYAYVYRSLPVTFPVLADGTAMLEAARDAEHQVVRALAGRA